MMNTDSGRVPDWDDSGLLPPFLDNPASPRDRSPYRVALSEMARRFGRAGAARRGLLSGLLNFRAALRGIGLTRGFQWIDGSFVEDVESIRGRAPGDIDVVTFFYIPEGHTRASLVRDFPNIFNTFAAKREFGVDSHFVGLNQTRIESVVKWTTYWHSLWGHTRLGQWKGFVEVDLVPGEDEAARAALDAMNDEYGGPL